MDRVTLRINVVSEDYLEIKNNKYILHVFHYSTPWTDMEDVYEFNDLEMALDKFEEVKGWDEEVDDPIDREIVYCLLEG